MAVLETIRVKFGILITVLIAVALLSFIIDPSTLQSVSSSMSSKYDVGEINGKSVSYTDFQADIDRFKVIAPPESIVKAFSVIVNSLLEQKVKCANEIRNLTSTRDSLLPKLMSGELKINEIDC